MPRTDTKSRRQARQRARRARHDQQGVRVVRRVHPGVRDEHLAHRRLHPLEDAARRSARKVNLRFTVIMDDIETDRGRRRGRARRGRPAGHGRRVPRALSATRRAHREALDDAGPSPGLREMEIDRLLKRRTKMFTGLVETIGVLRRRTREAPRRSRAHRRPTSVGSSLGESDQRSWRMSHGRPRSRPAASRPTYPRRRSTSSTLGSIGARLAA